MQSGFWKMVSSGGNIELYNMMIDPMEQHDLNADYPERVEQMKAVTENWWNEVISGTALEGPSSLSRCAGGRGAGFGGGSMITGMGGFGGRGVGQGIRGVPQTEQ